MSTIAPRRPRGSSPSTSSTTTTTKRLRRSQWLPISRPLRLLLAVVATATVLGAAAQDTPTTNPPPLPPAPHRVTIVGSGNFGSAVARLLGRNVLGLPHLFVPEIRMWVFEEMVRGGWVVYAMGVPPCHTYPEHHTRTRTRSSGRAGS